jgi:MFS family permease
MLVTSVERVTGVNRLLQLLLLSLSVFAVNYARYILGPLQETLRQAMSLSDNQVAWLQGPAIAVPIVLGGVPLGLLIDRKSRAWMIPAFVAVSILATLATAATRNLTWMFFSRCWIGLSLTAVTVAAYSMMSDLCGPAQRGRGTTVLAYGEICGAPAAFGIGGWLLGMEPIGGGEWRGSVAMMGFLLLPIVALTLLLREPPRTGIKEEQTSLRRVLPELWKYRRLVVPMLTARIAVGVIDGAALVWAAPSFSRRFSLSAATVGVTIAGVLAIAGVLGPSLGGPVADLCQKWGGPRRTMTFLALAAFLGVPAAMFAVMPNVTSASISLGIFLVLGFTNGTASTTLATVVIPGELRGLYIAITMVVSSLFFYGIAPVLVSAISESMGGPQKIGEALSAVCAVTGLLGAIVLVVGMRNFPGREEGPGERAKYG